MQQAIVINLVLIHSHALLPYVELSQNSKLQKIKERDNLMMEKIKNSGPKIA